MPAITTRSSVTLLRTLNEIPCALEGIMLTLTLIFEQLSDYSDTFILS